MGRTLYKASASFSRGSRDLKQTLTLRQPCLAMCALYGMLEPLLYVIVFGLCAAQFQPPMRAVL